MTNPTIAFDSIPNIMLMNGKPPFGNPEGKAFESFTVTQGNLAVLELVFPTHDVTKMKFLKFQSAEVS